MYVRFLIFLLLSFLYVVFIFKVEFVCYYASSSYMLCSGNIYVCLGSFIDGLISTERMLRALFVLWCEF